MGSPKRKFILSAFGRRVYFNRSGDLGVKGRLQDLVAGLGLIADDDFCACLCLCILIADCV